MSSQQISKPFLLSILATVAVVLFVHWPGITLQVQVSQVANLLAPLLLAAGFIERAVEVVISPWRDRCATEYSAELTALQAATPPDAQSIAAATKTLNDYRADTMQYAFALSFGMGLVAAAVGIRALWPFLGANAQTVLDAMRPVQRATFLGLDIVLSAALLSGGADGIHSVVTAFTGFFDASSSVSNAKASAATTNAGAAAQK